MAIDLEQATPAIRKLDPTTSHIWARVLLDCCKGVPETAAADDDFEFHTHIDELVERGTISEVDIEGTDEVRATTTPTGRDWLFAYMTAVS